MVELEFLVLGDQTSYTYQKTFHTKVDADDWIRERNLSLVTPRFIGLDTRRVTYTNIQLD